MKGAMRDTRQAVKRIWHIESGDYASASRVRKEFSAYLKQAAVPDSDCEAAVLIYGELIANALTHGRGPVRSSLGPGPTCAILWVEDAGEGFALERVALPARGQCAGRGIFIAKSLARSIHVARVKGDRFRVTVELPVRLNT